MITDHLLKFRKGFTQVMEFRSLIKELHRVNTQATELLPLVTKFHATMPIPMASRSHALISDFKRSNRDIHDKAFLGDLKTATVRIQEESATLIDRLSSGQMAVLLGDSISIRHLHALKLNLVSDFFLETTRSLLVSMAELEVAAMSKEPAAKSADNWIKSNFVNDKVNIRAYADTVAFFNRKFKDDIVDQLWKMDDVKVDEKLLKVLETAEGSKKLDPVGFNYLNVVNPFFWAYLPPKLWSEFKLYRLNLNRDELIYLELRHQELLLEKAGTGTNPKLDNMIGNYNDDIVKTRRTIKSLEDSMGD